jgi:hypothetical protein
MRPSALLPPLLNVIMLAGLAWSTVPAARAAITHTPLAHCKGSTRAHVSIHWPGARELNEDRQLHWGTHIPGRIRRWAYLIVPVARANRVDPNLVAAVIRIESNGDPLAWNLDGDAHGLMQVLHASFEPAVNVGLGVSMLAAGLRQFGNQDLAVAAYNAGPGAVQQYGGIPPYTETRDYVVMVDYYHDLFTHGSLPAWRTTRFKAAEADVEAYVRRICAQPQGKILTSSDPRPAAHPTWPRSRRHSDPPL